MENEPKWLTEGRTLGLVETLEVVVVEDGKEFDGMAMISGAGSEESSISIQSSSISKLVILAAERFTDIDLGLEMVVEVVRRVALWEEVGGARLEVPHLWDFQQPVVL